MSDPNWTDKLQAWTSLGAAIVNTLAFAGIATYTWLTKKTYDEVRQANGDSRKANKESLRPVLILFEIHENGAQKIAIYKNTGRGLALDIRREGVKGSAKNADSNVLAPDQELLLNISEVTNERTLDLRYVSLDGKEFITLSAWGKSGRVLNHYVPELAGIDDADVEKWRQKLEERAVLGDVDNTVKKILRKPPNGNEKQ